jgi:hypothetical protein
VIEVTKPDTIAPTKALLTEAIYNNGKVKLTWEPSSSEDATKQYILQRTNQQSDWKTVDSLSNTERKHYQHRPEKKASAYYYAIQTQDDNGLKSGRSNVMQVADPNYTEIPAPENLEAHVTEDQNIQLTWDQPEKVKDYRMMIYRSKGENAPLLYEIIDQSGQKFTDEDVSAGTYQYRIAIKRNSDGLLSKQSNKEKVTMKP